jgi:hypothetical protein
VTFFYWARFGFLLLLVAAVATLALWSRKGDVT